MKYLALDFIVAALTAALPCRAGEPTPAAASAAIHWNAGAARFEVTGLPATTVDALRTSPVDARVWPQRFGVYVIDASRPAAAPLLGAYAIDGSVITFKPRFPLRPGLKYQATFDCGDSDVTSQERLSEGDTVIDVVIDIPAEPPSPPATVAAVYPTSAALPQNLLKFYIHFTAAMSRGEAYNHLHIVDFTDPAAPREVEGAFLRLGEELWDAAGQRFTLLFDPGRIKRGLKPNEEMGAPLVAGRRYALVIDRDWRDAHGQPLGKSCRKEFLVTPFDDVQPDPAAWKLVAPQAGHVEPLVVTFSEPLDQALLLHTLTIRNAAGEEIDGVGVPLGDQAGWHFQPTKPWAAGDYELIIDPVLEDLAGNSVGRAFETHAQETVDQGTSPEAVTLPFQITLP